MTPKDLSTHAGQGYADLDPTEDLRRARLTVLGEALVGREELQHRHGPVWNPEELRRDYEVLGFLAPYVVVRRRTDGVVGSLEFQPHPRFYFNWKKD